MLFSCCVHTSDEHADLMSFILPYFVSDLNFNLDLNWKLIYVGSAESAKYDQVLDSIMVGPVPVGVNRFLFETDSPRPELIPQHEIRGVTVLLLTCSYVEQEFIRIGYYVDTDFNDEFLKEVMPDDAPINISLLRRKIIEDKPRVTRFNIIWDAAKIAQSKAVGNELFEIPEELLAIKEPSNFEYSDSDLEESDNSIDNGDDDEISGSDEEDISQTDNELSDGLGDDEEIVSSENDHPNALHQITVMDTAE